MTAPMTGGVMQNREQYRQRKGMTWTDQHGRAWMVEIDLDQQTMTWAGPPILKDARPPVDIPQVFVKPIVEDGAVVIGKIYCDYTAWRKEQLELTRYKRDAMRDAAKLMYPSNFGEVLKNPTMDLLIEVGPMPVPVELIEAMAAGNKWALGIRKPDGKSFYPKPNWVTEDMLARVAALKATTGWKENDEFEDMDATIEKYPDLADEEAVDPEALGGKRVPIKKGKRSED